ncbi:MAG: tRNA uridine-5-carboxymethylaminomethyl(34) synthesis GTPase MnmE, partial [Lachnospiraceae bacterium]|nr:tRNA uridine-5-carboxymethylaminomethyl(34) synthesis GTPase MnmE [Lachnospiraceae bacterium]
NKQDLAVAADLKTLKEELGQIPVIETSIVENTGLDQFVSTVREMFYKKEINFNDQVYITNARQKSALAAAEDALTKAMDSINMGMSEDFFTIDMMEAYTQLGLLIGETVEDDLADEIFSRFCMGK